MAAYLGTAGFMTHVTCRLTAKNRDQLRNPIRSVIEYGLPLPFLNMHYLPTKLNSKFTD